MYDLVAEITPGPSDHDPSVSYSRPHTAEFSCRPKCRPVFPDILNYPAEYGNLTIEYTYCYAILIC